MNTNPSSPASLMRPGRVLRILFSYVKPYSARANLLAVTLVIEGAFNILLALSLKLIIDFAIVPRNAVVLAWIIGSLIAGFLLTATSQVIRDYLYAWFGARIPNDLRKEMFRQLQRLSLGFYVRNRTGDIAARFSTDLAAVENAVVLGLPGGSLCLINIIFSTGVLFALDWRLALAAVVGLPLCVMGPRLLAPRALKAGYQLRTEEAQLTSIIHENLGAQPVIKAFSLKQAVITTFEREAEKLARLATRFNFLSYTSERSPHRDAALQRRSHQRRFLPRFQRVAFHRISRRFQCSLHHGQHGGDGIDGRDSFALASHQRHAAHTRTAR